LAFFFDIKGILNMNSASLGEVGPLMRTQVLCKVFKRYLPDVRCEVTQHPMVRQGMPCLYKDAGRTFPGE